jgi:phenylacetate-CoA ligase
MYNPKSESIQRDELEQLQYERLQTTLNRVTRNVTFYRELFDANKIVPEKIKTIRDISGLPFTTKEDLAKSYPYGMFAVPLKDIVRIHSTSGTTGQPIAMGYTRNDIRRWSELVARVLTAAGVTEHDLVMVAFHYSLFTGGLGFHYGAELLGASVIPASESSDLKKQFPLMKDFKTTAIAATPSYALKLIHAMKEAGVHPETLHLKRGVFGAEPWNDAMRRQIEESLHIDAYDSYGISEIMGPGISGECVHKNGLHIQEDHFLVEVIDPATLSPLPAGVEGELVITTLQKEGFPLVRYRTGDRASLMEGACACGRTFRRMTRISGRTDDMLVIRGIKFFPSQIEAALAEVEKITPHYQVVIDHRDGADILELRVEISDKIPFFDEVKKLEKLKSDITVQVRNALNISAEVHFVEPNSLADEPGKKTQRVVDKR